MSCKRGFLVLCAAALLLTVLVGCGKEDNTAPPSVSDDTLVVEGVNAEEMFTDRDKDGDASSTEAVSITLADAATTSDGVGVQVDGDTVTVSAAGTYCLQGTLTNGRIVVDATNTDKIQLILSGVSVSSADGAALYIKQADKVFVTLAADTQNALSNTGEFVVTDDNNIDGAVFSKDDLTFNGTGSLSVRSTHGHGIVCKDSLAFVDGVYDISSVGHAVQGKDDVRIADGKYTLQAGKDGIHVENADDTTLGYLYVADGDFTVTADGDGLSASGVLQIDGGKGTLTAGGGAKDADVSGEMPPWGGMFGGYAGETEDTVSAKGIKSAANLLLKGGTWTVNAADDAIHSNASATITDGTYTVSSSDDGIHADEVLLISAGTLTVTKSYEGLEGTSIEIKGGTLSVTASDDGLNAAGGNDQSGFGGGMPHPDAFSDDGSQYIRISGGKLTVNAAGDGIDSNGGLYVTGGETYVSGPTNSGNGALDYGGEAQVSGCIFVACGSSGMAQGFSSADGQGAALINLAGSADELLVLKNDRADTLVTFTPAKSYSSVVISCPGLTDSGSYTLSAGGLTTDFTMSDWLYGGRGGMGGMNEPMGGGMGGHPGGHRR